MLTVEHANGDNAYNTYGHEFATDELQDAIAYLVAHNDESYTGGNDWLGTIESEDGTLLLVNFDGSTEEL